MRNPVLLLNIVSFLSFWLCWVSICPQAFLWLRRAGLPFVTAHKLLSSCGGFSRAQAPGDRGFSRGSSRPLERRLSSGGAQAQLFRARGISQVRDGAPVSCVGRQTITEPPGEF